jgi:hypothetical protein
MNISELRLKIDQNSQLSKDLQNQYRKLDNENRLLQSQLRSKEIEALSDYIEIGQSHTIFKFVSFSGVQTGGNTESLYFRENDVIEFIKKNKRSIVIKCTKRLTTKGGIISETNPNSTFRINIDSMYHYLMSDKTFKLGFETFLNRKESLNILGI